MPNSKAQTNAPQEPVRLDKKSEIVLKNGVFVTIYKVKLGHLILCDGVDDLIKFAKLIRLVTRFDDKEPTSEDVLNLDLPDFFAIVSQIQK